MALFFPFSQDRQAPGSFQVPVPPPQPLDPLAGDLVSVCFNKAWLPAVLGSLFQLLMNTTWQATDTVTEDDAIRAANALVLLFQEAKPGCPTLNVQHGTECTCMGCIRVDCNGNVFYTKPDGTEGMLTTSDQLQKATQGQPGGSTLPPVPAGGGCATYHFDMAANGGAMLPNRVSTGDTIDISNQEGLTSDTGGLVERCPDGFVWAEIGCVETPFTVATDPLPSVQHSKIIANIGGTFYDVLGTTFTVPAGHSGDFCTFQVNGDRTLYIGELHFDVTYCNNAAKTWTHTFDFSGNPHGWTTRDLGVYAPGSGFHDTASSGSPVTRSADIQFINATNFTLTRLAFTATDTPGAGAVDVGIGRNAPGSYIVTPAIVNGTHVYDTGAINLPGTTNLYFDNIIGQAAGDPGGSGLISSVTISGVGFDPFASL